jgi:serine/threonine protein kinase
MRYNLDCFEIELDSRREDNLFRIGGEDFFLEPLYPGAKTGKGGNSCVFLAVPSDSTVSERVVKFCRFATDPLDSNFEKRIKRFRHEIRALTIAKSSESRDKVIAIEVAGEFRMSFHARPGLEGVATLLYYVMENAESDLERHLQENDFDMRGKIELMRQAIGCIRALHDINFRHRDLKPDNIFVVNGKLKVGDLGLIEMADSDYSLDGTREKIGPSGFLSPEAVNKAFGDHRRMPSVEGRTISNESDVFQLGLILFHIMQGEVPVGHLAAGDFVGAELPDRWCTELFYPMLQFRKRNRPPLAVVSEALNRLANA